ncbi:MAG: pyrroline-5-carboxylate reductase [Caldimicrobium sp.]|nr:pyrroline-5-carboxylate reductase [Caldimicrobium sp.]MDW8094294.1 pyrroline-5-carboxylate reductase [Caldimicrobium sp.]
MLNRIGIIGGGQMAEALIKGFLDKEMFTPQNILVSEPLAERRQYLEEYYGVITTNLNSQITERNEIVILAVKPQVMASVLREIKDHINPQRHLIITIAAGLPLKFYEKRLPEGTPIVRVMLNTCALVHSSISALAGGSYASEEDIKLTEKIFSVVGEIIRVEEDLLDAVTALSGSGPAYVALFIEALIDAGLRCGLPRVIAEKLVFSTLEGTIKLAKLTQKNPYEIKSMVTSPGGTTISALEILYRKGFTGIVIEAIKEAWKRSQQIREDFYQE